MANDVMQIVCFKCQTVYEITGDLAGQIGECTVCGAIFQIPEPIAGKEDGTYATSRYVEEPPVTQQEHPKDSMPAPKEAPIAPSHDFPDSPPPPPPPPDALSTHYDAENATPTTTHTVKLSRSSFGMLPSIDDSFGFSTVNHKAKEPVPNKVSAGSGKQKLPSDPLNSGVDIQEKLAARQATRKKPRRWWQFWKWFRHG